MTVYTLMAVRARRTWLDRHYIHCITKYKRMQTFSNLVRFVLSRLEILTPDIWRIFFRIRYIEIPSFLRDHYLWILLIMMPRLQILHFPGQEMTRLPKNSNWKLGFSGKKISSNVRCQNFQFTWDKSYQVWKGLTLRVYLPCFICFDKHCTKSLSLE